MAGRFARAVVVARVPIVVAWLAAALAVTFALPSLEEAGSGGIGQLVAVDSRAVEAERLSADLFAFPLSSRTLIVQRAPGRLAPDRLALAARRLVQANTGQLPVARQPLGAYGLTNAAVPLRFARERDTTTVTAPVYPPDLSERARIRAARAYARSLDAPPGEFVGLTGVVPARAQQGETIADALPRMELLVLVLVTLTMALYLRSAVAPLVTLFTVAVAYLISTRLVAVVGQRLDLSVPAEVEPVIVALLFGVVTDYALFYMSRFKSRLAQGADARAAALRTTEELTPVVLACGVAVAIGAAGLIVAQLGFLRAFGPGVAVTVLISLGVTITLLPATLAILGARLFWPSSPARPAGAARSPRTASRMERLTGVAVRAPKRTVAVTLFGLGILSSGVGWLELGNPTIRGLPTDSEPNRAFRQLSAGFAPGVAGPTTLIVTGPGIAARRDQLRTLQVLLEGQPGMAGVIGPTSNPAERTLGIVLSRSGDAARFILVPRDDPLGADAVRLIGNLRARTDVLLEASDLGDARFLYAGDTTILSEVIDTADEDVLRVIPAVLLGVALVLAVFLRAIVAPLYLVLVATLSPLAAIGLAVAFFQGVLGEAELTFFVPLAAGVLLIALGSDYNIFLVGRIWNEARERPLTEAIVAAGGSAAHAISAAGLILSASFAALAVVPLDSFRQLAFVLAVGLLIDAFVVRSILTPAVVALVGERSGWPGGRLRSSRAAQVAAAP